MQFFGKEGQKSHICDPFIRMILQKIMKNIFDELGDFVMAIIVMAIMTAVIVMFMPHADGSMSFGKSLLLDLEAAICGTR